MFKWQKLGPRMVHPHQPQSHERKGHGSKMQIGCSKRQQIKPTILKPKTRGQSDSQTDRASSLANFYLRYLYFILALRNFDSFSD